MEGLASTHIGSYAWPRLALRNDEVVLVGFLLMALGSLFLLDQDRRLRQRNTLDEIKDDPRLNGYLVARPAGVLLGLIAAIIAIVGAVRWMAG
jgi:hypothetical protein